MKHLLTALTAWAHAPWHEWMKEEPIWLEVFAELWTKIPESAVLEILKNRLIVLPPVFMGRIVRIADATASDTIILQLDLALLKRPREEAIAILAHELAHIICKPSANLQQNDLDADQLVSNWGLEPELKKALANDLQPGHLRLRR
ncbi:MAG: hypothetical protein AB7F43_14710 [Bacteriovoracia bacterium]